jgi:hypothetical protein
MPKIQVTENVTIDDKTFQLNELSAEVQAMIAVFDEWRQDEADLTTSILKTRGALRDLQNQLVEQIRKDMAPPAEEASEAPKAE